MGSYSGAAPPSQERKVRAGDLDHHVLEWMPAGKEVGRGVALLLHGYMDVADSWDAVAPALAAEGFHVVAPDFRGFGDGPRAAVGTSYYFPDYVADVFALAEVLSPDAPLTVVGHSMGGVVATLFAGSFPARVIKLANLEGLGPPSSAFADGPSRMRDFVESTRKYRGRGARPMADLDEVLARLAPGHPGVPVDILRARAPTLVRARPDGGFEWRFDPLHRARSPVPFYVDGFVEFAARVTCPVLFVGGGDTGYHPPDEAARLGGFRDLRRVELAGAGHMMHWTAPDALVAALVPFVTSSS